jgi:DNA repair exonuclease SbcCD ATPase subunit
MNNLLSQQIQRIKDNTNELLSIGDLYPEIDNVRDKVVDVFTQLSYKMCDYQKNIQPMIFPLKAVLQDIITKIAAGDVYVELVFSEISNCISILSEARTLSDILDDVITSSRDNIAEQNKYLTQLEVQLKSNISALQSESYYISKELEEAEQRRLYLIALGPFGVLALPVVIALITEKRDKLNSLISQLNAINMQVFQSQNFCSQCNNVTNECREAVSLVSQINNTLDIIVSSFENIKENLEHKSDISVLKLFITASANEIDRVIEQIS